MTTKRTKKREPGIGPNVKDKKLDYSNGKFPALASYIDRVGAEQRNFKRFVIKREGKNTYHYDAAIISIDGTTIRCSDPEYSPTASEAAAIAAELAQVEFPKSIPARNTRELKPFGGENSVLFEYRDADGFVIFVQERLNPNTWFKTDLPWTYWSDRQWRCMEPSGDLPLWGLDSLKDAPAVFLHEGAKTAQVVQLLVWGSRRPSAIDMLTKLGVAHLANKPGDNPWIDDLKSGVHLGWPGGAPNPHRVDWSPIKELSPDTPVYIVCDNDMGGENAAPLISKILQRHLKVIRFGEAWPQKFDLADPWPTEMWKERKGVLTYAGPSFDDCLGPATWATRLVPVKTDKKSKSERLKVELRDEFVNEWLFCVTPLVFMQRDSVHKRLNTDEFNAKVAPYSGTEDVARLLRKKASAQADKLAYEPGLTSGRTAFQGAQVINVYRPSSIEPIEGDFKPFLEFMAHLIPDEQDRNETIRWCATLVARPDIRMAYSVILASQTQGVGKTTLAEHIVAPLVGLSNCSFPTAEMVLDKFTTWRLFKRLAVIGEIYEGQSANAYNKLKTYITDLNIDAREMYVGPYTVTNHLHVLASSNSLRPLKLDAGDRRWLVPGVTEDKRPKEYFTKFYSYLEDGGLPAIAHWMRNEKNIPGGYVLRGTEAPMSAAKLATIKSGMGEGERLITEIGERLMKMKTLLDDRDRAKDELGEKLVNLMRDHGKYVVRLDFLRNWLAVQKASTDRQKFGDTGQRFLEKTQKIGHLLRQCGLYTYPRGTDEMYGDGGRQYIAATFEVADGTTWADLQQYLISPLDVAYDPTDQAGPLY